MAAIQSLKKQLRGIRSTQKLTKAMKTVATVKFSQLSGVYGQYAAYGNMCRSIYERHSAGLLGIVREADPSAPSAVLIMASNKGLCGSFNSELLAFAAEETAKMDNCLLIACGKKAVSYLREKGLPCHKEYIFGDVPTLSESAALLDELIQWRQEGKVSRVFVIYPRYANMMIQIPTISELFPEAEESEENMTVFVPDRETVVENTAKPIFRAMLHKLILETAVGAQAATLMTMRAAYDTATDYCAQLEGEINRTRQSTVTADVLETAGEHGEE